MRLKIGSIRFTRERQFGTIFIVIFMLVALAGVKQGRFLIFYTFLSLGGFFFVITVLHLKMLSILSDFWEKIGLIFSKINNPIVFGFLFFIFLTPVALIMRLFKRDELRIRHSRLDTYWINHEKVAYDLDSFRNQF
jgi:hypothetical protein